MARGLKIGTLTYYNNGSYGAALQAFALQEVLTRRGHEVQIIRYARQWPPPLPLTAYLRSRSPQSLYAKLCGLKQRRATNRFRLRHLKETPRAYYTADALRQAPPACAAYVCGSDQVWNPWTYEANGRFDTAYFLDFGQKNTIKVAYAPSFGRADLPGGYANAVRPLLQRLDAISVRERSAITLVKKVAGRDAQLVLDPTLLLAGNDYEPLTPAPRSSERTSRLVVFLLGSERSLYLPVYTELRQRLGDGHFCFPPLDLLRHCRPCYPSVNEWLGIIRCAAFVLTDSYHGTAFAILHERPFIVLQRPGGTSGRTDRLYSLLAELGLQHRIVSRFDADTLGWLCAERIDWTDVRSRIHERREKSLRFLDAALHM